MSQVTGQVWSPSDSNARRAEPIAPFWMEGAGFRIGRDLSRSPFVGLVGTDRWAVELTEEEFQQFCQLACQLAEAMAAMAEAVMVEESLAIELELGAFWMEAEGFPDRFSLRFILSSGRGVEGEWDEEGTAGIFGAIGRLGEVRS